MSFQVTEKGSIMHWVDVIYFTWDTLYRQLSQSWSLNHFMCILMIWLKHWNGKPLLEWQLQSRLTTAHLHPPICHNNDLEHKFDMFSQHISESITEKIVR